LMPLMDLPDFNNLKIIPATL